MDGLFSAVLNIKQLAVTEFFMHESEAAIGIHGHLLAVYGEDIVNISTVHCWVRKLRCFGGNLDLKGLLLCGIPVITTHDANRQKSTNLFKEIDEFLREL